MMIINLNNSHSADKLHLHIVRIVSTNFDISRLV